MPDVFELALFNLTRTHRFGRMLAFERLNTGHLITTYGMVALHVVPGRILVGFAHVFYLLFEHHRVRFRRVQPIPAAMRLQLSLVLKNVPPDAVKCLRQYRV